MPSKYTINQNDKRFVTSWEKRKNGRGKKVYIAHCTIRMGFKGKSYWTQNEHMKGIWEKEYRAIHQALTETFKTPGNDKPIFRLDLGIGARNFFVYFKKRQSVEIMLDPVTRKGQFSVKDFGENNDTIVVDAHNYEVTEKRTKEEQRNEAATNDTRLRLEDTPLITILRDEERCFYRPSGRRFLDWSEYHKGKLIILCNYIYSFQPDPDLLIDKIFGWLNELAEREEEKFACSPSGPEEQLIHMVVKEEQFDAWIHGQSMMD